MPSEKRCAQLESEIRELKDRETTRRLRAVPSTPPDAIVHADGRVMFLEIKRSGGRLSEDQRRIADHLKPAGHAFEVVDNLEAAIAKAGACCGPESACNDDPVATKHKSLARSHKNCMGCTV